MKMRFTTLIPLLGGLYVSSNLLLKVRTSERARTTIPFMFKPAHSRPQAHPLLSPRLENSVDINSSSKASKVSDRDYNDTVIAIALPHRRGLAFRDSRKF